MKKIFFVLLGTALVAGATAQNVGVNITSPTYPLTVGASSNKGIVQKDGSLEVGFWTSGTAAYLQTWSNHSLHLAVNNGNAALTVLSPGYIGIGTTSPTTNLDISGGIRFRSGTPATGSVITSTDANGYAAWKDPIAFRTAGLYGGTNENIPENVWTEVLFSSSPAYNIGSFLNPTTSRFNAPEKGIYHFDASLRFIDGHYLAMYGIRLRLLRGATYSTLAEFIKHYDLDIDASVVHISGTGGISTDVALEAGDYVWVEVYCNGVITPSNISYGTLYYSSYHTWFNGHIVTRY
ncbi:MAG TPA: hypothetical protein VN451_02300 [Chitinophagaceae bacterium]|nr:hypothetical protein [Chitinophagaceae bacterium]